jgi:hypothetical protein
MVLSTAQRQAKLALKAKRRKDRLREKAQGRLLPRSFQRSSLRPQIDVRRSALDDQTQSLEGHLRVNEGGAEVAHLETTHQRAF